MTLEVEFWTLLSVMVSFLGAIVGIVWGLLKSVLAQTMERLEERESELARRLDDISKSTHENSAQWARVERELLTLKADLPVNYVRRDDYVTSTASILTKLDSMSLRFENVLLKGGTHD